VTDEPLQGFSHLFGCLGYRFGANGPFDRFDQFAIAVRELCLHA
jgi:hypothetical protein